MKKKTKRPDVLAINTYAGSLLVAARSAGLEIRGSYEDVGYGSDIQRRNFPDVQVVANLRDWPEDDLSNTIVIGHPPCAPFSNHAVVAHQKSEKPVGVDSKAFECTKRLLEYAAGNGAAVICIESVQKALEKTREFHDDFAAKHGYIPFRLLVNSRDFGVPQERRRFWIVFFKADRAPEEWSLRFERKPAVVGDILLPPETRGPGVEQGALMLAQTVKALVSAFGKDRAREVMLGKHGFGRIVDIVARPPFEMAREDFLDNHFGARRWSSCMPIITDPLGVTLVLLGDSVFVVDGRTLSRAEHRLLTGFPADYWIPVNGHNFYLSRGVCPPVAEWLLGEIVNALTDGAVVDGAPVCHAGGTVAIGSEAETTKRVPGKRGAPLNENYDEPPASIDDLFGEPPPDLARHQEEPVAKQAKGRKIKKA